jgi:chorismate dehydratase
MYTLGVPRYANTAPLYRFLPPERFVFRYGVPTELNQWLLEGSVDLSLVSSYFYLKHAPDLKPLPDFSVADLGPVYSVNLFHNKPWEEVKQIALTTESATSVQLLKHLIKHPVAYQTQPGGLELLESYDGVLLIGDQAIQSYCALLPYTPQSVHKVPTQLVWNNQSIYVTDLSLKWFEQTRLPFVFALWATRAANPPPAWVLQELRAARSKGLGNLALVAAEEAARLGVPASLMQHYLFQFRYHLETPDRLGLATFAQAVGLPYPDSFWDV